MNRRVAALAIRNNAVVMRGEGPEGARVDEGAAAVLARLERQPVVRAAAQGPQSGATHDASEVQLAIPVEEIETL